MRVFLFWDDKDFRGLPELMAALRSRSHTLSYWVGYTGGEHYCPAGTLFHSSHDAMVGVPAQGIEPREFPPPGEEIIRKLYRVESLTLTMMNRVVDGYSVDERKHLYYTLLRYWLGVLQKYQPEFIIFSNMPHFVYDYIVYELALLLSIRTIAFDDARIPGRLLYFDNFWDGFTALSNELERTRGKTFSPDDLGRDIQAYYVPRADKRFAAVPPYIALQKEKYEYHDIRFLLSKILKNIRRGTVVKKGTSFVKKIIIERDTYFLDKILRDSFYFLRPNLKREYATVARPADFTQKFVYLPLQVQPERTTSPQGDMFVDQILVLEILSAALPDGWSIFVKEHPMQWPHWGVRYFGCRYPGYYKKIAAIPRVRVVPIEASSYELMNKAEVVAAVTGSAGWEALMRGKPFILFGRVWFEECPGVLRVRDVATCRDAFAKIQSGFAPSKQEIVRFLKCFDAVTLRAFTSPLAGKASGMAKEESMKNISEFLIGYMKNLRN